MKRGISLLLVLLLLAGLCPAWSQAEDDLLTDGNPVGEPVEVWFDTEGDQFEERALIYGVTKQALDNGFTRFTMEYTLPAGMEINIYYYSRGVHLPNVTAGERSLLTFDISDEALNDGKLAG